MPSPFNLETCARPNIIALQPYRCARDDYQDNGSNVLLDANENAFGPSLAPPAHVDPPDKELDPGAADDATLKGSGQANGHRAPLPDSFDTSSLHRYPDPHQERLKQLLCRLRNDPLADGPPLTPDHLFVGVGSDEAIDCLLRCFCVPAKDRILTCPPTYGMYAVSAQVNDVAVVRVPLLPGPSFALDLPALSAALTNEPDIKLVYLCSPGNPTGSLLARSDVEELLAHPTWNGVIIVDEAYIDFATSHSASLAPLVPRYPNLVVLQTLSKAFGMAGIRLGAAFASPPVARLLNSLKAPYNISSPTSALACSALGPDGLAVMRRHRASILAQRDRLLRELPAIDGVGRLRGGTDANFLLFEMLNAQGAPDNAVALAVYKSMAESKGVVVRFRGNEHGCLACLRITVGTEDEVTKLIHSLRDTLAQIRGPTTRENGTA